MIRTAILGMVSAVALSGAANAADIYRGDRGSYKDGPMYSPLSWTGFYLGVNVGGTVDSDVTGVFDSNGNSYSHEIDNTVIGGVHVGYNFQAGSFVFGAEADVNFLDGDGSTDCPNDAFECGNEFDTLGSVRGRLGFAYDKVLVYGTAGIAFTELETRAEPGFTADGQDYSGFVYGGGIEYKISPSLSFGAEVLVYDFDEENHDLSNGIADDPLDVDLELTTVRARLTYHLN